MMGNSTYLSILDWTRIDVPQEYSQRQCNSFSVRLCIQRTYGLIPDGNTVKHEQKKKDKSARLLKELDSATRDAVDLT